jgi:hypothetical protein
VLANHQRAGKLPLTGRASFFDGAVVAGVHYFESIQTTCDSPRLFMPRDEAIQPLRAKRLQNVQVGRTRMIAKARMPGRASPASFSRYVGFQLFQDQVGRVPS